MNVALIFAGGTGSRMNIQTKPKQFLEVDGRAIIIHTLEHFDNHPAIDAIAVVCLESWIPYMKKLLVRHHIQKVKWVVPGGSSGQGSIYNGLQAIHAECPDDSIVLIHDGVRPLIDEALISANLQTAVQKGNSITTTPAIETIVQTGEDGDITATYPRQACSLARAPQCFRLGEIWDCHQKAIAEDRQDFIDSASIMMHYGHTLYTTSGPAENIKITTPLDYFTFKSILDMRRSQQAFGI